jgi:transposase
MRYELADYESGRHRTDAANKPHGVPRVNDRRVLNGILWVLRSGAPWRDLRETFGPYSTCYNRFVRWRRAGVWSRIRDALAAAHDAVVQMIDCPRASAWSLHRKEPTTVDGTMAGRVDQQDSRARGYQRPAGPKKRIRTAETVVLLNLIGSRSGLIRTARLA